MTAEERKQAEKILADELNLDRLSPLQYEGIMRAMIKHASLKVAEAMAKMPSEEKILRVLNEKLGFSTAHYTTEEIAWQKEVFDCIVKELLEGGE